MKKIIALSTVALMGGALMATPALAQSVGVGVGGNAGVSVGGTSGDSTAGAGVNAGGGATVNSGTSGTSVDGATRMGTSAGATVDNDTTTAAVGTEFDSAVSILGSDSSSSIGTMSEVGSVNVVRLSELQGATDELVNSAETQHSTMIQTNRESLEANTAVTAALEAKGVSTDDVLGAGVNADGSLTVYVR